jgi:hypothetical protein
MSHPDLKILPRIDRHVLDLSGLEEIKIQYSSMGHFYQIRRTKLVQLRVRQALQQKLETLEEC